MSVRLLLSFDWDVAAAGRLLCVVSHRVCNCEFRRRCVNRELRSLVWGRGGFKGGEGWDSYCPIQRTTSLFSFFLLDLLSTSIKACCVTQRGILLFVFLYPMLLFYIVHLRILPWVCYTIFSKGSYCSSFPTLCYCSTLVRILFPF